MSEPGSGCDAEEQTAASFPGSETDLLKELSEAGSGCEAEEQTAAPFPGSETDLLKEWPSLVLDARLKSRQLLLFLEARLIF